MIQLYIFLKLCIVISYNTVIKTHCVLWDKCYFVKAAICEVRVLIDQMITVID